LNCPPPGFHAERDLPPGFMPFYAPLHAAFAARQQALAARRIEALAAAHAGRLPEQSAPSDADPARVAHELPAWARDQRNQMTGPADDAELVVKMLNSGAPA